MNKDCFIVHTNNNNTYFCIQKEGNDYLYPSDYE